MAVFQVFLLILLPPQHAIENVDERTRQIFEIRGALLLRCLYLISTFVPRKSNNSFFFADGDNFPDFISFTPRRQGSSFYPGCGLKILVR